MRISYNEDEDWPGQFFLWQANCQRSLHGRAGQAALRELATALRELPEKRLASGVFVATTGEVCALGALAVRRKEQAGLSHSEAMAVCADMDPDETQAHGEAMGFPSLVAWKVVEQNDIMNDTVWEVAEGPLRRWDATYKGGIPYVREMTPEERYDRVLAWVERQVSEASKEKMS